MYTLTRVPLLLLLLLFVAACDSNSADEDGDNHEFNINIAGAIQSEARGEEVAFDYGVDDETGERAFAVVITLDAEDGDELLLAGVGDPDETTYAVDDIENGDAGAMLFWKSNSETGALYISDEGSFVLTDVGTSTLKGRMDFEAVNAFDETKRVHLTGTFTAKRASLDDEAFSMHQLAARTK